MEQWEKEWEHKHLNGWQRSAGKVCRFIDWINYDLFGHSRKIDWSKTETDLETSRRSAIVSVVCAVGLTIAMVVFGQ